MNLSINHQTVTQFDNLDVDVLDKEFNAYIIGWVNSENVDDESAGGYTLLYQVSFQRLTRCVQTLLEKGADPMTLQAHGHTPPVLYALTWSMSEQQEYSWRIMMTMLRHMHAIGNGRALDKIDRTANVGFRIPE